MVTLRSVFPLKTTIPNTSTSVSVGFSPVDRFFRCLLCMERSDSAQPCSEADYWPEALPVAVRNMNRTPRKFLRGDDTHGCALSLHDRVRKRARRRLLVLRKVTLRSVFPLKTSIPNTSTSVSVGFSAVTASSGVCCAWSGATSRSNGRWRKETSQKAAKARAARHMAARSRSVTLFGGGLAEDFSPEALPVVVRNINRTLRKFLRDKTPGEAAGHRGETDTNTRFSVWNRGLERNSEVNVTIRNKTHYFVTPLVRWPPCPQSMPCIMTRKPLTA